MTPRAFQLAHLVLASALACTVATASPAAGPTTAPAASAPPAASFTIRCDWYDRGNVTVSAVGQAYADRFPCIWNGGPVPNQAEFDLDFPVDADYTLWGLYAAQHARPMDIFLDGKRVAQGFDSVTGSWQTSSARWQRQCTMRVQKGRHTLKLLCPGPCMPHICALRFESPVPFPADWKLQRPTAQAPAADAGPEPAPLPPADLHALRAQRLLHYVLSETEPAAFSLRAEERPVDADLGPLENNELAAIEAAPADRWSATLTVQTAPDKKEEARLPLSQARLRATLAHACELIADFRTMKGVLPDYLEPERLQAAALGADVDRLSALPAEAQRREHAARLALAVARLDARVMQANPLLNFDRLLLVRRGANTPMMGLPWNWQSNCALPRDGFDDEIATLSPVRPGGKLQRLYRPDKGVFVGDLDLHFDGTKMLFSSIGTQNRWHVFEIGVDGTGLRQVTRATDGDVDHYDACYLPDGRILFMSTAYFAAVPCVNGSSRVANLYRMDADGGNVRQLCFDQEHDWCPTVLPNGRVLYLRWEYTDTPHSHDRVLFTMNPDGTEQMEHYGSNSYWPNSLFYARPVPGQPTQFAGIVSGHHGTPRKGELVLFDVARGRREADGAVQRIPGRGRKVEPIIADNLVDASWPKFLHPWPLNEKYFLAACQPTPDSPWGIYLVDVYDGMLLLREEAGCALLEPIPLRATPRPPVIPDRVDLQRKDALVYIADIYAGGGLAGVPRDAVKSLRLFTYHFLYPGMGGPQGVVGMEGPWDIKRIMGTVPVEPDGSAYFRVPANTPISIQPLDAEGKALQLMRSWLTGMPGEVVSCVGCHEGQNAGAINRRSRASVRPPSEIQPWHGPTRGFNFAREVQPVLDKHCVACHDGKARPDGRPALIDLRGTERIKGYTSVYHFGAHDAGHFSVAYGELHRFVRRPGLESDYHMLMPLEFHADTTQLVQMLQKGHHGVRLEPQAWDRLITWIDLNAPFHGTWSEIAGPQRVAPLAQRRRELLKRYGGIDDDAEAIPALPAYDATPIAPPPAPPHADDRLACPNWPFDAEQAGRLQAAAGPQTVRQIDLEGLRLELVLVPPGEFVMGDQAGYRDEQPRARVKIHRPFWMGRFEVTNQQYARFDPRHDSRVESKNAMQFGVRGFYVNGPSQPVVRVSWERARAFCEWLSRRTGLRFALPTEAQWEWACRAGTAAPLHYGGLEADFSAFANLADLTLKEFVCHPYIKKRTPFPNPNRFDDWIPKDERFRDEGFVSEPVGRYKPNAWGLHDMHGNVWEWTASAMRPYPWRDDDGRNQPTSSDRVVVRGGSWRDRPRECRSAMRLAYRPYQGVFNVGFRVVAETGTETAAR